MIVLVSSNDLKLVFSRPIVEFFLRPTETFTPSDAPTIVPQPLITTEFLDMDVLLRDLNPYVSLY